MVVDDNQGWTRAAFHDHNLEVVCMKQFLTTKQCEGVNGHHVELSAGF